MINFNKILLFVLIFVASLHSSCLFAMDLDDQEDLYGHLRSGTINQPTDSDGRSSVLNAVISTTSMSSSAPAAPHDTGKTEVLERAFSPYVARPRVNDTAKQVAGGITAAVSAPVSFQTFVPTSLSGLGDVGLGPNVIPDTGVAEGLLLTTAAAPIVIAGGVAAYDMASNLLTAVPDDVQIAKHTATEMKTKSFLDSWTYSYTTKAFQFVFWGGLAFSLMMNIESKVTSSWGNPYVWGAVFGTLMLPIIYYIIVRASNNPNNNPNAKFTQTRRHNLREPILNHIQATQAKIRYSGLTDEVNKLGQNMNAIYTTLTPTVMDTDQEDDADVPAPLLSPSAVSSDLPMSQLSSTSPKYIKALNHIFAASKTLPGCIRQWDRWSHAAGALGGDIMQALSVPGRIVVSYGLLHELLSLMPLSSDWAFGLSITGTVLASPFLILSAYKETCLAANGIRNFLRLNEPKLTAGNWGGRIAPTLAPIFGFAYLGLPVEYFLRHSLLPNHAGVADLGIQLTLIIPLMGGTLMPAAASFFSTQYEKVANWIAKGSELRFCGCQCKILCCVDTTKKRKNALEVMSRLQDMEELIRSLNLPYLEHLRSQLTAHSLLTESETSSLL